MGIHTEKKIEWNFTVVRLKWWHVLKLNISISGDASINTLEGSHFWRYLGANIGHDEPVENNPEYIYHLNKEARILINIRNPVDRYLFIITYKYTKYMLKSAWNLIQTKNVPKNSHIKMDNPLLSRNFIHLSLKESSYPVSQSI